jgi:type VI secretion system Hcp family effector
MTVMGERQGNITAGNFTETSVGNIYQEEHESECLIEAFEHKIFLPRDPQSGQSTGQRVHLGQTPLRARISGHPQRLRSAPAHAGSV